MPHEDPMMMMMMMPHEEEVPQPQQQFQPQQVGPTQFQAFASPFTGFGPAPQAQFLSNPQPQFAQFQQQPFSGLQTLSPAPVAVNHQGFTAGVVHQQPQAAPTPAPAPAPTAPAAPAEPAYLGTFTKARNNVEGDVFMLDESTLYIQGFSFDGQAPDVYFWSEGVPIPYYTR